MINFKYNDHHDSIDGGLNPLCDETVGRYDPTDCNTTNCASIDHSDGGLVYEEAKTNWSQYTWYHPI